MMIKKLAALLLAVGMLLSASALAQTEEKLFDTGREALALLSYGEYDQAMALMGLTHISREEFAASIEEEFRLLFRGTVQTEVAVLYCTKDSEWFLALPVAEPTDDRVETMVFSLDAAKAFSGVSCCDWKEVLLAVDECRECTWNVEYMPASPILETDT